MTDPTPFSVTLPIRVTAGPYNGMEGVIVKLCDSFASILVNFEGAPHELVVEVAHLVPLQEWLAGRSETELRLRGHGE
jgi:hypothetical protein